MVGDEQQETKLKRVLTAASCESNWRKIERSAEEKKAKQQQQGNAHAHLCLNREIVRAASQSSQFRFTAK